MTEACQPQKGEGALVIWEFKVDEINDEQQVISEFHLEPWYTRIHI